MNGVLYLQAMITMCLVSPLYQTETLFCRHLVTKQSKCGRCQQGVYLLVFCIVAVLLSYGSLCKILQKVGG